MQGHRVFGAKLKRLRLKAGLTQEQLAQLVDCSDRLIRRAEASFPVRLSTLERIAGALSELGQQVEPSDLTSNHLAIAKRLWNGYAAHGRNLLDAFPYFTEEIHWSVSGPKSAIPFAGEWQGRVQLQLYLSRFHETIERMPFAGRPLFLESENYVAIKFTELWQRVGKPRTRGQVWGNFHISFRDGMVRRVEHQFDTFAAAKLLADSPY